MTRTTASVLLANPRGFCAGVERAISTVKHAIHKFGKPIYVRHEVVHNRFVCDDLRARGAIFVEELDEVPSGSTVVFSAHGVSRAVREEAERRGLRVFDATCPLVTKVHLEVVRMNSARQHIVMIGHKNHPEVEGTMGQADSGVSLVETLEDVQQLDFAPDTPLAYVTQTTLSMADAAELIAALQARYPRIQGPKKEDICYATQNRQDAVKAMAVKCDAVIVVGSPNSSNSNRLREVAQKCGADACMVESADLIDPVWVRSKKNIGVTAGASAPEVLVQAVVKRLRELGCAEPESLDGKTESVHFPLPRELKAA